MMGLANLLACLLHLAGALADRQAAGPVIADVTVQGNKVISTDRIKSVIKTRPGANLSRDRLCKDVSELLSMHAFRSVHALPRELPDGRVNVDFTVQEFPNTIQSIVFKNAGHLSENELRLLTGLKEGFPLSGYKNRQACSAIERALYKQGRLFAKVSLEEGLKDSDRRVILKIEEGPIVRVSQARVEGDSDLGGPELLELVGQRGMRLNPLNVELGVYCIDQYLQKRGGGNFAVSSELRFSDDYRSVQVIYHVRRERSPDKK